MAKEFSVVQKVERDMSNGPEHTGDTSPGNLTYLHGTRARTVEVAQNNKTLVRPPERFEFKAVDPRGNPLTEWQPGTKLVTRHAGGADVVPGRFHRVPPPAAPSTPPPALPDILMNRPTLPDFPALENAWHNASRFERGNTMGDRYHDLFDRQWTIFDAWRENSTRLINAYTQTLLSAQGDHPHSQQLPERYDSEHPLLGESELIDDLLMVHTGLLSAAPRIRNAALLHAARLLRVLAPRRHDYVAEQYLSSFQTAVSAILTGDESYEDKAKAAMAFEIALPAFPQEARADKALVLVQSLTGMIRPSDAATRTNILRTIVRLIPYLPNVDANPSIEHLRRVLQQTVMQGDASVLASRAYRSLSRSCPVEGWAQVYERLSEMARQFDAGGLMGHTVDLSADDFGFLSSCVSGDDTLGSALASTVLGFVATNKLHADDSHIFESAEIIGAALADLTTQHMSAPPATIDELASLSIQPHYQAHNDRPIERITEIVNARLYTVAQSLEGNHPIDTEQTVTAYQAMAEQAIPQAVRAYSSLLARIMREYPDIKNHPRANSLVRQGVTTLRQAAQRGINPAVQRLATSRLRLFR